MSVKTIENMIDWVEQNLDSNPTLCNMSEHVGYSTYYCSTKFHEYTGISFKEYVIKRKLSLAAMELLNTKIRIIDVAANYGFSSHEAFSRAFLKVFGFTPSKYRNLQPKVVLYKRIKIDYMHTPIIKK